jgi:exopolyphosphatase/pppGpp-phosphohydrolase
MKKSSNLTLNTLAPEQEINMVAVIQLAEACNSHNGHTQKVTLLSLLIFDGLQNLHRLKGQERFWLQSAAILHDIGTIEGKKEHHKASLRIILNNTILPFNNKERLIIASIARYHRKALPNPSHDHFAALNSNEQEIVLLLSSMLRLADGLIQCVRCPLQDVRFKAKLKKIFVTCKVTSIPETDRFAREKSDLMEKVFNRKVIILWKE